MSALATIVLVGTNSAWKGVTWGAAAAATGFGMAFAMPLNVASKAESVVRCDMAIVKL
jgi:hypothetical protein